MIRYLARRAALMTITLVGVSIIVFLLGRVLPTPTFDMNDAAGGAVALDDARRWQEARYGLDRPLFEQYYRWCRAMIVAERDVLLWTDEAQPRALYQIVDAGGATSFLVRRDDGVEKYTTIDERPKIRPLDAEAFALFVDQLDRPDRAAALRLERRGDRALHAQLPGFAGGALETVPDEIERAGLRIQRFELTLGYSRLTNRPVMEELSRRVPVTAAIGLTALAIVFFAGTALGITAGAQAGGALDRIISGGALVIWSLPMAVSATVVFGAAQIGEGATVRNVALAAPVLALPGMAYVARQVRAAAAEQMHADYVRTAVAKGCSRSGAVMRHALRPCMIIIITMMSTTLPIVIGGSIIVESVFGIDAMGRFLYHAAMARDYDVVQAFTLLAAALNMGGIFIADILYALVDPRVRFEAVES